MKEIPIIDLFAGPGGLGEGFSQFRGPKGERFRIKLSIEKDPVAHKTLTLRAFYRQFHDGKVPNDYYDYLAKRITRDELEERFPKQWAEAYEEAKCVELGAKDVDVLPTIKKRLGKAKNWVLIGGPPCQAYSLVGRSRMTGAGDRDESESERSFKRRAAKKKADFENDHRHLLYREYLKIIAEFRPAIFVMENVKGILSAKLNGERIFPLIREDLSEPLKALKKKGRKLGYSIHSLVVKGDDLFGEGLEDRDFLIKAEEYGVPQCRHRVILVGIRSDVSFDEVPLLEKALQAITVKEAFKGLPPLVSGLSKNRNQSAYEALQEFKNSAAWKELENLEGCEKFLGRLTKNLENARQPQERDGNGSLVKNRSYQLAGDEGRLVVCNHETRSHIQEDLWRYFFAACFAEEEKRSAHLSDFPRKLLPHHKNVEKALSGQKFGDRFRVQVWSRPSTTVVSHISKDGHYYIHPNPKQYRSLTVREAARLQTFPDNYLFEGPRTQQFHQVGNAVPPKLAFQISKIIFKCLRSVS